jgi:GNAT superfamily N-acetyltransferase
VGAARQDEIDEILEGISASFSPEKGPVCVQNFCRILQYEPLVSLDYLRVVRVGGQLVAGVIIIPLFLRIGQAVLKAAGLTGVATWHGQRHKGYASLLMNDVHRFLAERGFDIVTLNSAATELYLKHGYEMSHQYFFLNLPWEGAVQLAEAADEVAANYSVRRATTEDIRGLHEIFSQNPVTRARRVYFSRTYARFYNKFRFFEAEGKPIWVVASGAAGEVDAYGWESGDGFAEVFSINDDLDHYRVLLHHFVKERAGPQAPLQIALSPLPEHHHLIQLVREYGGTFFESPVSAKMSKLLAPSRVLSKMVPEWEWLLQSHVPPAIACDFFIDIQGQAYHFVISNGHLDVIESDSGEETPQVFTLRPQDLATLIIGIAPAADILEDNELYQGDATREEVLDAIFPARKPFILPFDDY